MSFIFMDESGDLGFNFNKKGTTTHFLITFLFCRNRRPIEKCVRKVHSGLRKKYKNIGILHAYIEEPTTKRRLLTLVAKRDCRIMTILLNKKKVYTKLQDEKPVLYNYVTNILLDRIFTKKLIQSDDSIEIIASRKETNKFLNQNFRTYLHSQISKNHKLKVTVSIKTPAEQKALQAVDFISWAIFRKYEYKDDSYYKLIKKRIVEENPLFP